MEGHPSIRMEENEAAQTTFAIEQPTPYSSAYTTEGILPGTYYTFDSPNLQVRNHYLDNSSNPPPSLIDATLDQYNALRNRSDFMLPPPGAPARPSFMPVFTSSAYLEGEAIGAEAPEIGPGNRGRALLEKMGWTAGSALGGAGIGVVEPVTAVMKQTRLGLGAGADKKARKRSNAAKTSAPLNVEASDFKPFATDNKISMEFNQTPTTALTTSVYEVITLRSGKQIHLQPPQEAESAYQAALKASKLAKRQSKIEKRARRAINTEIAAKLGVLVASMKTDQRKRALEVAAAKGTPFDPRLIRPTGQYVKTPSRLYQILGVLWPDCPYIDTVLSAWTQVVGKWSAEEWKQWARRLAPLGYPLSLDRFRDDGSYDWPARAKMLHNYDGPPTDAKDEPFDDELSDDEEDGIPMADLLSPNNAEYIHPDRLRALTSSRKAKVKEADVPLKTSSNNVPLGEKRRSLDAVIAEGEQEAKRFKGASPFANLGGGCTLCIGNCIHKRNENVLTALLRLPALPADLSAKRLPGIRTLKESPVRVETLTAQMNNMMVNSSLRQVGIHEGVSISLGATQLGYTGYRERAAEISSDDDASSESFKDDDDMSVEEDGGVPLP